MGKYDLVVFDLDGTLMDTSGGILACIDYIVGQYGFPPVPDDVKRGFIGPPIQDSFLRCYSLTEVQAWEMAIAWRNAYKDRFLFDAVPYDGIYDLLRFCQRCGASTGVATNKREDYTRTLLEHFGFTQLFDCICGTDMSGKLSKAELIRACMERTNTTDPEKCLMVGDTEGDFAAAKRAGVQFLGVTYGFGFTHENACNLNTVSSCRGVIDYLQMTSK